MAKRDYYEILGVSKPATKDEIKKAYRKLALNITQIKIKAIKRRKISLKRQAKPIMCCLTIKEKLITISSVMQLLKVEEIKGLVILILDLHSLIFLKIFLGMMCLVVVEGLEGDHLIEGMI